MPDEDALKKSMEAAAGGGLPAPRRRPTRAAGPAADPTPPPAAANVAAGLSPRAFRKAARTTKVEDALPCKVALRMAFVGAGQGGGRMAQAFRTLGYRRVAAWNTTSSDFEGLDPEMPRFSLEVGGAGKDMQAAADGIAGHSEDAFDLMTRAWGDSVDWAFVCAGLGGGTGSGTGPALVRLAREYLEDKGAAPRVGAIVSLPRVHEGQQQARNAVLAFRDLIGSGASPILIIDNARIDELYAPGMRDLHPTANSVAAGLLHTFNRLAAVRSKHVSFDRSELEQLLGGGIVVMAAAALDPSEIASPAAVSAAVREQLAGNVLASVDLARGRKAACLFVAPDAVLSEFPSAYFDAGVQALDRIVGSRRDGGTPTVIHSGIYEAGEGEGDDLQVYAMVSELEPPLGRLQELSRKGQLDGKDASGLARFLGVAD